MIKGDAMTLGPWHRGVFYNLPPEEVPADGLSDMENVRVGQAGQCEKRPGCASYQSAAVLSGTPAPTLTLSCQLDLSTGTSHVVIAAGTALYKYSSGWSAITGSTTITAGDDNVFYSSGGGRQDFIRRDFFRVRLESRFDTPPPGHSDLGVDVNNRHSSFSGSHKLLVPQSRAAVEHKRRAGH